MTDSDFSLFLSGDAIITRPWSHVADAPFLRLVEEIRSADVSITNLETIIHEYSGFAQNDYGGTHLASPPAIAAELKWAGFQMLAHANNHTFDYGSSAVLETVEHVNNAGLILAGSGKDLQQARAPRYFRCAGGVVALVSMAASFTNYGRASRSRSDMHGRPGLNPLTLGRKEWAIVVRPESADVIRKIGRALGRKPKKLSERAFSVGFRFHVGDRFGIEHARRLAAADREANLATISEASDNADIVVASIHAHNQNGRWLSEFAGDAIGHGADIVFVQGPHEVRAIEIRDGKPIFYSMGDFLFETESLQRFPSEAYDALGLGDEASPEDLIEKRRENRSSLLNRRPTFEGFSAILSISNGRVSRIRLLPIDLQFDGDAEKRGRPQLADPQLAKRIVGEVAALSRTYGTQIGYNSAENFGEVEIP